MTEDDDAQERQINIHFSPEIMAGVYANFANVSHSDYEFTITFARVDHEVDEAEIPGVVVSRINLSAKFMRELIDAMRQGADASTPPLADQPPVELEPAKLLGAPVSRHANRPHAPMGS